MDRLKSLQDLILEKWELHVRGHWGFGDYVIEATANPTVFDVSKLFSYKTKEKIGYFTFYAPEVGGVALCTIVLDEVQSDALSSYIVQTLKEVGAELELSALEVLVSDSVAVFHHTKHTQKVTLASCGFVVLREYFNDWDGKNYKIFLSEYETCGSIELPNMEVPTLTPITKPEKGTKLVEWPGDGTTSITVEAAQKQLDNDDEEEPEDDGDGDGDGD